LAEQLASEAFKDELEAWLDERIEAARHDAEVFEWEGAGQRARLARHWEAVFTGRLTDYRGRYDRDLIGALRRLQDAGAIEIITRAGTHHYLRLIGTDASVRAQLRIGVESYRRHFARAPRGSWLAGCAYRPRYDWAPPVAGPKLPRRGI